MSLLTDHFGRHIARRATNREGFDTILQVLGIDVISIDSQIATVTIVHSFHGDGLLFCFYCITLRLSRFDLVFLFELLLIIG